jgi:pyridoxine/pyridoxamine 5'-phosphate oxidase
MKNVFFDSTYTPKEIERNIFHELARPLQQGGHPFQYPTLATVAKDHPQQRSLVLRKVHSRTKKLWFFTDARTAKVNELAANPQGALHFYHPKKKLQLRLQGALEIIAEGPLWQEAFNKVPPKRYADYASKQPPGKVLKEVPSTYPMEKDLAAKNFRLMIFSTQNLEALQLNGDHHFRIAFNYESEELQSNWLQP